MTYNVIKRDFNSSKWICAPTDFLLGAENIKTIDGAKWIWNDFYCRFTIRKYFEVSKIEPSYAHFICDNIFDLFINGTLVSFEQKEFEGDITQYLVEGTNRINIRAYQTNDISYFTSAMIGEVKIGNQRFCTDESWQSFTPASFWENTEQSNWQTTPFSISSGFSCDIHPRLNKRSVLLRKSFELSKPIADASLFVSNLGQSETYINGSRTDSDILGQGINKKYQEYREYDVTSLLKEGKNALGAITANGWYNSESHSIVRMNRPHFICELVVKYEDGSEEIIGSDNSFKCAFSPLTDNDIQFGERYDARLEIDGWADADFDDSSWVNVQQDEVETMPFALRSYPPIVIKRLLKPTKVENKHGGIFLTFPENCCGRFSLEMKDVKEGQHVKITVYERLRENGDLMIGVYTPVFFNRDCWEGGKSLAAMSNLDVYTCRGKEKEVYEPHFAFTGYRYMLIEGLSEDQLENIYMTVMHNDLEKTGELSSSYTFINDLFDATNRTWLANVMNGPMDCPTREKNYWTGDMNLFCATACYLNNCLQFLGRWTDGGRKMCSEVYGWGDEIYIIPLTLYRFYGDKKILKERFEDIVKYAEKKMSSKENGLPTEFNSPFNDHLSPELMNVKPDFFSCTYYCYMLKCVSEIASILNEDEISKKFDEEYKIAVKAYNERFFNKDELNYNPPNQSGIVLPLAFGLVPDENKKSVAEKLNDLVRSKGRLDTGFGGTRYLMNVLSDNGYTDTAFMLLDREEFPSWKNMLSHGTGTICESWKGAIDMMDEESISMNHFTLGAVVGWMFECLGGIRFNESEAGFAKVTLKPNFVKEIGSFKCSLNTVNGKIASEWSYDGDTVTYNFECAVSTKLILPNGSEMTFEAGKHTVIY